MVGTGRTVVVGRGTVVVGRAVVGTGFAVVGTTVVELTPGTVEVDDVDDVVVWPGTVVTAESDWFRRFLPALAAGYLQGLWPLVALFMKSRQIVAGKLPPVTLRPL